LFSRSNAEFKNFLKIQGLGFWGLHRLSLALRPVLHKDLETLAQNPGPPKGPQNGNKSFVGDQRACHWLASAATMAWNLRKIGRFAHRCGSPKTLL